MNIQSKESTVRNTGKIENFKLTVEGTAMLEECDHGSYLGMEEEQFLARKLKNRQNFWFEFFHKPLGRKPPLNCKNPLNSTSVLQKILIFN